MKIDCLFCKDTVHLFKIIKFEHALICFACIERINTAVAAKYREHGWHITKDALIVNNETKEVA